MTIPLIKFGMVILRVDSTNKPNLVRPPALDLSATLQRAGRVPLVPCPTAMVEEFLVWHNVANPRLHAS